MNRRWAQDVLEAVGPDGRVDLLRLGEAVSAAYEAAERARNSGSGRGVPDKEVPGDEGAGGEAEDRAVWRAAHALLEHVDQGVVMLDPGDRVILCNRRARELLDLPAELMAGRPAAAEVAAYQFSRREFDQAPAETHAIVKASPTSLGVIRYERRRPNGLVLDVRGVPLPGGGAVRTFTDITDLRASQDELRRAEADYRSLFENAVVGVYRSSLDGRQLRANPALVRLNGYEREDELLAAVGDIGKEWYVEPGRRDEFRRLIERDGRVIDFVSEVYRHRTRERLWVSENAWLIRDANGAPLYFEGMVVDVTERRRAEARITWLAHNDSLTGLANRNGLVAGVERSLAEATDEAPVAILAIDLGRFTELNDTLGHTAGDALLRMAARRVRRIAGPRNLAARLGSDEFAIIVTDALTRSNVLQLCERVLDSLHKPFRVRRQRAVLGATIGVAFAPEHGRTPEIVLRNASSALYAARANGAWPYAIYSDEMNADLRDRLTLEADLRKALQRHELSLNYQPIVNVGTGEIVSAEALLRWRHPERGFISPAEFIPLAEETGLVIALGEWTLREACREGARTLPGLRVAVNLSPAQFRSDNLVPAVMRALADSGLPPDRLELEITESVLLRDDPFTLQSLMELRAIGVRVALDDFGSGHASFGYLAKFRFDKIKIDRSFIASLGENRANAAIVRAVASLGADLGVGVVAEGVETAAQAAEVRRLGCDLAQGYLFCPPTSAEMLAARLAADRADAQSVAA